MGELYVRDTETLVSVVTPEMTQDWFIFALRLKNMGDGWAIERYHQYLDAEGRWTWAQWGEEEWHDSHIFTREQALEVAAKYAPEVKSGPNRAADVAAGKYRVYRDGDWKLPEE